MQLLKTKLGLFTHKESSDDELRQVLQAFPTIIRYKGSERAINLIIALYSRITNTSDFANITLILPKTTEFVQTLITVCALQLISYEVAYLRGCDIDKPKNLAKSVTVE